MNSEIFVVIRCGYEGIESLVYACVDEKYASEKVKSLRQDILDARNHREEVLKEFGDQEDENLCDAWDRMYFDKKISGKEHEDSKYREPDSYCVQKWNGNKFSCVCKELGCEPEKSWLM